MMATLFLRVFAVSAAVSLLLLPLLFCRGWLERTYSPKTRWGLWLALALVLLIAPWIPKPQAPVVVEAPAYTVTLPALPGRIPAAPRPQPGAPVGGQTQPASPAGHASPAQPGIQAGADTSSAAQAEARPAAQRPTVDLTAMLGGVWLAGLTLVLLRQGLWYLLARRRLLRSSTPVTGLEHYAAELDLEGRVTFYHCKAVPGPMTLGLWRPAVLLPPDGLAVAALRHELYHVKRRDVAYKLLLLGACALHWFNPLVWLLYRQADRDVEACCDAAVVAGRDSGYRRSYGELLLSTAAGPQPLPFTTSFGGEVEQMKARLTQLFRPGKQSRSLVCLVLVLAVALGSLVACREKEKLADGVYCSPYANVVYPVGDAEADGEDYGVMGLSLLDYDEISGPHGKPLGEYTLPLSGDLTLRQLWWGEDRSAGEKGTQDWQRAVHELVHAPMYRDSIFPGTEYLVVTVKGGEITRLSWAQVSREDEDRADPVAVEAAAKPLTENTMPTLVYYDPARDFLLYRTVDTAYFHYGDSWTSYRPDQSAGRRVLWRCDVSEDEQTVYLSDVYDDSTARDERFYAWDIASRTLRLADSIPAGVDHMTHMGSDELFYSGFMNGTSLKSNVIKTHDGTLAGLYVDELIGNTIDYLQLARMREDGTYEADGSALGINAFLTPERIPAPRTYTDPAWGFTLQLPESLEGNYVVSRAANNWNFYDKELYPNGGYLFSLWAEDSDTQEETIKSYPGQWPGRILGEKDGITYTATFWSEDMATPAERESEGYMARMEAAKGVKVEDLDLSAVTRSSGYLWPLPYIDYGSDRLLGEEDNTLRILASDEVTVQSAAGGTVVGVTVHPVTGDITVVVEGPVGWYCEYGHLEYVEVENGTQVKRGDILGFVKEDEEARRWLSYRLLEGEDWRRATVMDPWSVDYRTYDFLPVTRDSVTVAGDLKITRALREVLYGDATFYDVETGEYCYADALPFSDGVPVKVYRFTQLDMDGDTIPEMVLWLQRGEDIYQLGSIILRYQNGWVYGYPMGYRSMNLETLKADGTYSWSGGAPYNGWGRKDFLRDETVNTVWHDYDKFYVNGNPATEEAYDRAVEEQDAKPDVVWYSVSEENPGGLKEP